VLIVLIVSFVYALYRIARANAFNFPAVDRPVLEQFHRELDGDNWFVTKALRTHT
jgi:hypothetical protein